MVAKMYKLFFYPMHDQFFKFSFLNILSKYLKTETPLLNKYNRTTFVLKNYSTDSNSSDDLVILPKFSRPGLRSIQNLPNISRHQIVFRIVIISETLFFFRSFHQSLSNIPKRVPIFQLIYPLTAKWSGKAATIVGQIFRNHIPTIFVDISDGRRKSQATLDFILNKNALGAKFQSVYAMNLEEDDFFMTQCFNQFLPISSSILFFVFEIVFSHCLRHMHKCCLGFPTPGVVPAWPRIIKNRWVHEHTGTSIWTQLYFVSYHSFENPPLVSHYSLCKTFVLTNFDF